MKRYYAFALCLALLYVSMGSAQQYSVVDKIADQVIQKYQTSTCEQLWQKKSAKAPPSAEEQKAMQLKFGGNRLLVNGT